MMSFMMERMMIPVEEKRWHSIWHSHHHHHHPKEKVWIRSDFFSKTWKEKKRSKRLRDEPNLILMSLRNNLFDYPVTKDSSCWCSNEEEGGYSLSWEFRRVWKSPKIREEYQSLWAKNTKWYSIKGCERTAVVKWEVPSQRKETCYSASDTWDTSMREDNVTRTSMPKLKTGNA